MINILKKLSIISLLSSSFLFGANQNYLLVDEYINKNPNQKIISKNFIEQIRNEPVKISEKNKEIKIVMVYPGNQISDYWRRSKVSFEKRLDALGINYELVNYFTKPGIQIKEQSKQLLKAIKNDTDYLIFTLDAKKHSRFVERIISRKKPKLILQNITTPIKKWGKRQPFLYVGFDHVEGSKLLADFYINKFGKNAKYALLYGTEGYVSSMRGDEFVNYLQKRVDYRLVDSYYTNFNKEKAIEATRSILKTNKDIDFIYAASTDIALGVVDVLKEKNLIGKIAVNGWGGGSNELKAIKENLLDVTVMRINDDNGIAMAEAVKLDLEGRGKKIPTIFSGDFELIKKGIKTEKLEEFKNRAFRYSNGK